MYFNDAIDDIIEPIFEIENLQIKISDYTIYRYTGYMGVEGVCEALKTDFTSESKLLLRCRSILVYSPVSR